MSNENSKHAYCANADDPSPVASGMMISLTLYYQHKADRIVRLIETRDFDTVENMVETFNATLSQAPDFAKVPDINYSNRICYPKSGEYSQYKICPETECEELVYAFDQNKSMIEGLGLQDHPLWKQRVEVFKMWYKSPWEDDAWNWENKDQDNQRDRRSGNPKRAFSVPARIAGRVSGSPELLKSPRTSPEVPQTSPEVFRRPPRKFSHC